MVGAVSERFSLHLGDCVEGMLALEDRSVDHVIADPEYSERVHERFGTEDRNDGTEARGDIGFAPLTEKSARAYAAQYCRVARGWIILFCDEVSLVLWKEAIECSGGEYIRKGTWVKTNPAPQMSGDRPAVGTEEIVIAHAPRVSGRMKWNGGGKPATYHFPVVQGPERIHPAQKPIDLICAIMTDFTDMDSLILDSHLGSGAHARAAIKTGRRLIGWEKDPEKFKKALDKTEKFAAEHADTQRQQSFFERPMKQLSLTGAKIPLT